MNVQFSCLMSSELGRRPFVVFEEHHSYRAEASSLYPQAVHRPHVMKGH